MSYKIGILIDRLNGGGAERAAGIISKLLSELGHKIFIVTLFDDVAYPYQGKLINLGKYKTGSRSSIAKYLRYKKLHTTLKAENPDLILDFRMKDFPLREKLLNRLVFKYPMVNMVRSYKLEWYFPQPKKLAQHLYSDYAGIITVAKEIKQEVQQQYGFSNVTAIPNAIDIKAIQRKANESLNTPMEYIIAVGRNHPVKQFEALILAFSKSNLPKKGIKLVIMGDGNESEVLKNRIMQLNLQKQVQLLAFQTNPFPFLKHAKFLVLSSKYEGFPNVLVEALACETPVVAFNCSSGPSEIIQHEKNGLLVENQNFKALTQAMNRMIDDRALYEQCKGFALESVACFSIEKVKQLWKQYLTGLKKE